MIEQQRQRVEQEMTRAVDEVDKTFLRKMQAEMHHCAAKCCEDKNATIENVQRCVERCSGPVTRAQKYVQNEFEGFQGRLQRCVMQCNDDIKVKMPPNPSESDISKYTDQFERCAIKCVDKHVGLIPNMLKTIKAVLAKGPQTIPEV